MQRMLWQKLSLRVKIAVSVAISILLSTLLLVGMAAHLTAEYNQLAQNEVEKLVDTDLDHITGSVFNLVNAENEAILNQLEQNLNMAKHWLLSKGDLRFSQENITWQAVNQFSKQTATISLPAFYAGETPLMQLSHAGETTGLVDQISHAMGETVTFFQRMNSAGDMLRIATTVLDSDLKKAAGTFIPAINPDGSANQVIANVLQHKKFIGRAYVVNAWYLTAYDPLLDETGEVIGMIYAGIRQKTAEQRIRQAILKTTIGKTGYVYVLSGQGEDRGHYVISQNGLRDGENILETQDSDGNMVVRQLIDKATKLKTGEFDTIEYRWQNPGEAQPRWKIARLAYFSPWDWVIGTSVYKDELQIYSEVLTRGRERTSNVMLLIGLFTAILAVFGGYCLACTIVKPINEMTEIAGSIIKGNMEATVEVKSEDETGILAKTFNHMTSQVRQSILEVRQSEERYRTLFEGALEGVFLASLDGVFFSANPSMAQILGFQSVDEMLAIIGNKSYQLFVNQQELHDFLSTLLNKDEIHKQIMQVFKKNGHKIWLFLGARLIRSGDNQPLHFQGFALDITELRQAEDERMKLEQQLYQAQKMETVGQLAGGIAHDFNNLLTPVMGYADLMKSETAAGDRHHIFLNHIIEAAEGAKILTHRLLAFGRKQVLDFKHLNLTEVVRNFEKILRRTIRENIQIKIKENTREAFIKADSNQMEQVIMNLAVNAQDAMPRGGLLEIAIEETVIDETTLGSSVVLKPGPYIVLSISDTGAGIDRNTQTRIFEPFFTTKEVGKGTGLGLSTVFGIVKQHGGHISVYSEIGKGSVFKVFLPQDTDNQTVSGPPQKNHSDVSALPGGNETILIVEDEQIVRDLTSTMLNKLGYKVLIASGPEECFDLMDSHKSAVDLVLSDVIMPHMDGREMLARLQVNHPNLKMLFMSGYAVSVFAHHGVSLNGAILLQKPVRMRELALKVRQILDSR